MKISRRKFVTRSSGLLFSLQPFLKTFAANLSSNKKILVLIHLAGGNDWFNTVIPYQCSDYYQSRPQLAIASNTTLPLNNIFALHPSMSGIKTLYDQGKVSILLNVGHDQPTLSHHKAIEILQSDWLDRYAKLVNKGRPDRLIFPAINIEEFSSSKTQMIVSSLSPDNKFTFNVDVHYRLDPRRGEIYPPVGDRNTRDSRDYPHTNFGRGLKLIADLIKQNHHATVYNISLGGFDTHENQSTTHAHLLNMLSEAVFSFQNHLEATGLADRVLTIVYSEFGRHLKENDESGTDHGFTNHVLVIGDNVKGRVYGSSAYLADARPNHYQFDFRQIYATILEHWLECPSEYILGTQWKPVDFVTDRCLGLSG